MRNETQTLYTRMVTGCLLMVLGAWGIYAGIRAAKAQAIYHAIRHGRESVGTDRVLQAAERARRLYPHNFYMAYQAADRAFAAALDADSADAALRYFNAVEFWCREGLRRNPYRSEIQWLKTRMLSEDGQIEAAIAQWRAFVETEFWNPDHHAALAELYLLAGDPDRARESLAWANRSHRFHALSAQARAAAEKRERR